MIGGFLGFFAGIGIVISAWQGTLEPWGFGFFAIAAVVGVVLFPMTVGIFMTNIMIFTPIALLAGLITGNGDSALVALGLGVGAFITQFIVGAVRNV
jgi:hypothetical protein